MPKQTTALRDAPKVITLADLIDEAAELDADEAFQAKRKRYEGLREALKKRLGIGEHQGNLFLLSITWGTPQNKLDTEAIKADHSEEWIARYTKPVQTRAMNFVRKAVRKARK